MARCLKALGHEVIVADPNFAPMYATRTRKVKTDRRDARALAEACLLGAAGPPSGGWTSSYRTVALARSRTTRGIVRPSAAAVLRLITSSKWVGCSMGSSAGLVPRVTLATYGAAWR